MLSMDGHMYGWIKRSVEIMTCTLSFKYIIFYTLDPQILNRKQWNINFDLIYQLQPFLCLINASICGSVNRLYITVIGIGKKFKHLSRLYVKPSWFGQKLPQNFHNACNFSLTAYILWSYQVYSDFKNIIRCFPPLLL